MIGGGGKTDHGRTGIEKIEVDEIEVGGTIIMTIEIEIAIMRNDTERTDTTKIDTEKIEVEVTGKKISMEEIKVEILTNGSITVPIQEAKRVDLAFPISHSEIAEVEAGVEVEEDTINRPGSIWLTMPTLNKANI